MTDARSPRQSADLEAARVGHADVALRPAALVVPVRQGPSGPEVFMMQRDPRAAFVPGVYVFPGGAVDAADGADALSACLMGRDAQGACERLALTENGLAYWVAAVRECFEESGLLLARHTDGRWPQAQGERTRRWLELRHQLHAGEISLADVCRELDVRLALDHLHYLSHWITPRGQRRRFDTRFFLAEAPEAQEAEHDGAEAVASCWVRPAQALDAHKRGEFPLVFATRTTLELLASFDDTRRLLEHVARLDHIPAVMPRMANGRRGVQAVGPRDPAWAEIGRIDPAGAGMARYDIEPGVAVAIAPNVWRLTCANPGYMTGPGTNTYLLGNEDGVTVIDPGPADDAHVQAILTASPGPIRQILVTHTHADHSPAVQLLRTHHQARVIGWAPHNPGQDDTFQPDHEPSDGDWIPTGAGRLKVLHTPGHAANHLCYWLEPERLLFTGDHVMQGSTVVISPPDGNMADYLRSLERLLDEPLEWLAPAHGFLMDEPHRVIRELIDHRLRREALVWRALSSEGVSEGDLLSRVYTQLVPALKPVAARSLQAHLLKLQEDGRAEPVAQGVWRRMG